MGHFIKNKLVILVMLLLCSFIHAQDITINGLSNVYVGCCYSYSFDLPQGVDLNTVTPQWYVFGGTITNQTGTSINVSWTTSGSGSVKVSLPGYFGEKYIRITTFSDPSAPPDPIISYNSCSLSVIIPGASPPNGVAWYWQGQDSNGNSTALGDSNYFFVSTSGTYYIRAYKASTGQWSTDLGSVYVNVGATGGTLWYRDVDGDGYGNALVSLTRCDQPDGYVDNDEDCDDNDDLIHPNTNWYQDLDGDGFGDSSEIQVGCTRPSGFVLIIGDCDDNDPILNPNTLWYADSDGDGFGNPDVTMNQCTQPSGYVANNNDLCPSNTGSYYGCTSPQTGTVSLNNDENYVHTITFQDPFDLGFEGNASKQQIIETVTYFDGLGRAKQNIGIRAGGQGEDIVKPLEYDVYGRLVKDYLPYASIAKSGTYREDALLSTFTSVIGFYDDEKYEHTLNPYSEKNLETSPLNRIIEQGAPGTDWEVDKSSDSDHTIKFDHKINGDNEVKRYDVDLTFANNTYTPVLVGGSTYYPAGKLYKTITKDENWTIGTNHTTEEFKDKQGRVVLKRNYNDGAHDTYYIYDDYGNLTYVISPKVDTSDGVSATELRELCYRYVYDHRNRLVEKQLPGKEKEYIIYNRLDQPIMTQDDNQRESGEWLFTKYDAIGRVAYTGKAVDGRSREDIQADDVDTMTGALWVVQGTTDMDAEYAENIGIYYNNGAYPTTTISEVLTINYYDEYVDRPTVAPMDITLLGSETDEAQADNVKGLPTVSKVKVLDNDDWIHNLTYYDKKGRPVYSYSHNGYLETVDIVATQLDFVGKPLKTRTQHSRNNNTIVTIDNFDYDHVGRLLSQTQCIGDGQMGDSCAPGEPAQLVLPLTGTVTQTSHEVAREAIILGENFHVVATGTLSFSARIDPDGFVGGSGEEELIVSNQYDQLGQLIAKKVGGAPGTEYGTTLGLQTVDYEYNIRGWLMAINDVADATPEKLFNFRLMYNDSPTNPLYNGNISAAQWRTDNDDKGLKSYVYSYDPLNRITAATGGVNTNYDVSNIGYDKNGNILQLNRRGNDAVSPTSTNFGIIDDLVYQYDTGNKLLSVTDSQTGVLGDQGFRDGNKSGNDYVYDENGNMTQDLNKGIKGAIPSETGIAYNHLNLPVMVKINDGGANNGTISYIYDATGVKLRKNVLKNGEPNPTFTDYAGNYIYENGSLAFFSHPEGYVYKDGTGEFNYVYNYVDHLGNIRLSYTDDPSNPGQPTIIEENNFYPFGLKQKGYNSGGDSSLGNDTAQKRKFANEEFEEDLGKNTVAYQWRDYDPAVGRFNKIDRFAEKYVSSTPYNYAANNPMYFIDVQGDSLWIQHKGNKILYENGNVYNKDGTAYTGEGVKVKKDGTIKLKGFLKTAVNGLTEISEGAEGSSMISELQSSDNNFTIVSSSSSEHKATDNFKAYANQWATDPAQAGTFAMLQKGGKDFSGGSGGTIYWNSSGTSLMTTKGNRTSATTDLAHEMFHALDANRGLLDDRGHNGLKRSEWQATYRENILRTQLGLPARTMYRTKATPTGVRILTPAPLNKPIKPTWYK